MREDMAKLLVERPRLGGGGKYRRGLLREWQRVPLDEWPKSEAIKERCTRHPKMLNENLAPLWRFLRSRCGRPWDEVYGEICQQINRDSAVQLHVWQHLMWGVARTPLRIQKLLAHARRFRSRNNFYVEPDTGILREVCGRRKRWPSRVPDRLEANGRHYRRIEGIWYEIDLAPIPPGGIRFWDAVLRRSSPSARELHDVHGRDAYAVRKRQLNKREIRRLMDATRSR